MTLTKFTTFAVAVLCLVSSCAPAAVRNVSRKNTLAVGCEPSQLAVIDGRVDAHLTLTFPEGYFNPTAMLVLTPSIVYDGGKRVGKPVIFQGSDIRANYKVVPIEGAVHTMDVSFGYIKGMEQSSLELGCVMVMGQKKYALPSIKVADGCNVTNNLADLRGVYKYKDDGYEQVSHFEAETTIQYAVNSAEVRDNLANRTAINAYKQQIADFTSDERFTVTGTEVVAYASPEGGEKFNAELSDKRAKTAVGALARMSKAANPDEISQRGLGQDWEGFKEAVEQSDIQDKNLILRLLEMYSDPAEREAEIRNLSEIFEELKTEVFPALRRATYIVKADMVGLNDEQLADAALHSLSSLGEKEILRVAANEPNLDSKEFYYRVATQRFQSDVAFYNLAMVALEKDKNVVARAYLKSASDEDADVQNACGVLEMRAGEYEKAMECFSAASCPEAKLNIGTLQILKGEYARAAEALEGSGTFNEALADLLAGNVDAAWEKLDPKTPKENYLKAVIAARRGDAQGVGKYLKLASSDPELKERAAKDVEFVNYR